MQHRSRTTAFALAAGLSISLSACGGDSSGDAASDGTGGAGADGAAAFLPADIADAGALRVATTAAMPPEGYTEADGELAGYEIEIMEGIGEILGVDIDWQVTDFASIIPGLQSARYDAAVGQVGITAERSEVVDFVTLVLVNQAFAAPVSAGLSDITIEDLCGMSVAVMQGSRQQEFGTTQSEECVAAGRPEVDLKVFQNANDAWLALQSDRTQIFWNGTTNVAYLVSQDPDAEIVGHHLEPYPTGIVLPEGSELGAAIEAAEQQMIEDGSYQAILDEWGLGDLAVDKATLNPEITW